MIIDLIIPHINLWDTRFVHFLFIPNEVDKILGVPQSYIVTYDKLMWVYEHNIYLIIIALKLTKVKKEI